jgi:hypothetical protein
MEETGNPGSSDRPAGLRRWRAFDPYTKTGGSNTTGIVNSGVLNPESLKGKKGGRIWPKMRIKDRIDAIIAREYEELRSGGRHVEALTAAARAELLISAEARRLNRARAR